MRVVLITLLLGLAIAACGKASADEQMIEREQQAVRDLMADPAAAQFRKVSRCTDGPGIHGEVNGKNAFGGYVGFRPFVSIGGEVKIYDPADLASSKGYYPLLSRCQFPRT